MTVTQKILWLGLAGAAGTLARYAMASAVQRWCGVRFPWGTFAVNEIVDSVPAIEAFLPVLEALAPGALITRERVRILPRRPPAA